MICGRYADTFCESNYAVCDGMHLNSDYPHKFFDVVRVQGKRVVLRSQGDGTEMTFDIHRTRKMEYAIIRQSSSFEKLFHRRPQSFKILPFKGE